MAPKRQEETLHERDVERISKDPMRYLREGDVLETVPLLALGKNVDQLARRYRDIMRAGASLTVVEIAQEFHSWDQYPELQEHFGKAKRHEQTAPGREKAATVKRATGPRPLQTAKTKNAFKALWADPWITKAELARRYDVKWTTINRWGKALRLGKKANTMNLSMISGPVLALSDGGFTMQHHTSTVYVSTKHGLHQPAVNDNIKVFGAIASAMGDTAAENPIFSAREITPVT